MPGEDIKEDLKRDILLNTIKADIANGTDNAQDVIKSQFPILSSDESTYLVETIKTAFVEDNKDKVSLVVTAPPSFRIDAMPTMTVVQSMIESAEKNILITGYSLSSYFAGLTDTIIEKSQKGVFVKFFVNNIKKQVEAEKLIRYKGRFLKLYDYSNDEDKMAALHAKVISVDMKKTLITSANLSYHGQQGNIELGTLIESSRIAKQVDDVLTQLIFKKIFREI
jgi:phosphatidylserine/phosphatidylglycerophosphate/cardiolipin synthase-like enzyme